MDQLIEGLGFALILIILVALSVAFSHRRKRQRFYMQMVDAVIKLEGVAARTDLRVYCTTLGFATIMNNNLPFGVTIYTNSNGQVTHVYAELKDMRVCVRNGWSRQHTAHLYINEGQTEVCSSDYEGRILSRMQTAVYNARVLQN